MLGDLGELDQGIEAQIAPPGRKLSLQAPKRGLNCAASWTLLPQ